MSNRSSRDELPTRSTPKTREFLETCFLNADHKALNEHLLKNPVQQRNFEGCLSRGLQFVQWREKTLSHVAPSLILLLQSGAKWKGDALLGNQTTPLHIICESPGDHHKLLDLMIESSPMININTRDLRRHTALLYAVKNANTNCIKCLIANGADVTIGDDRYKRSALLSDENKSLTPILQAIHMLSHSSTSTCPFVMMFDIFDLLLDAAVHQNKDHLRSRPDYILRCVDTGNVHCIKKLIKIEAPLDIIAYKDRYMWAWIAKLGNVELLKCMFNHGIAKDSTDQNGRSILWWVATSGNVEAVSYLLDLGVVIPSYTPEGRETQCEQCKENRLIIDDDSKQENADPCIKAIRENQLEITKYLDERGSKSCKSFIALRCAVKYSSRGVVSYLLNTYEYPLNMEYIIKGAGKNILTLLTEFSFKYREHIPKLLLDHGADPAKIMCTSTSANAIMTAISNGPLEVIAQYIRSGVNINLRSWNPRYGSVLPFEASVLHARHYVSVILLISGGSRGVFRTHKIKSKLRNLMKKWNLYDNNVTPLKQRCRSVILNHLSPRADVKIEKLTLPGCLIKFLSIPELDDYV